MEKFCTSCGLHSSIPSPKMCCKLNRLTLEGYKISNSCVKISKAYENATSTLTIVPRDVYEPESPLGTPYDPSTPAYDPSSP